MKKIIAVLMALVMLAIASTCLAEATDKPIAFAEFTFGDTFGSIRNYCFMRAVEFKRAAFTPRAVADAFNYIVEWNTGDSNAAICFVASPDGPREVAGYRCDLNMWFAYPAVGGKPVQNENLARLYAGEYVFNECSMDMFEDLKGKLTQVYGEPDAVTKDLTECMGELVSSKDLKEAYDQEVVRFDPTYAVWNSTDGNSAVVLKHFKENGEWERIKISYLNLNAELVQITGEDGQGNELAGL